MSERGNSKSNKLAKAKRLLAVERAMGIGMSGSQIEDRIGEEFGVTGRSIRRDIVEVQKKWALEAESEAPYRRNQMRTLLRKICQKAMSADKYSAAVAAANRLMELDGLKVLKIEHSGSVNHGIKAMTSGDKRERLEELMTKARERAATHKAN